MDLFEFYTILWSLYHLECTVASKKKIPPKKTWNLPNTEKLVNIHINSTFALKSADVMKEK